MLLRAIVFMTLLPLLSPTGARAQDRPAAQLAEGRAVSILGSAERLAAEAAAQGVVTERTGMRLSAGRVSIGLAAVAAGVAMMLIDPTQPTQPGVVSRDRFTNTSVDGVVGGLTQNSIISIRRGAGAAVLNCEPRCIGDVDVAILDSFVVGAGYGIGTASRTIEERGWRLHEAAIEPFNERSPAMKYGGAALATVGGLMAAFWSHVPVANRVAVSPMIDGGVRVSASIGF